jgi:hypothetical protein
MPLKSFQIAAAGLTTSTTAYVAGDMLGTELTLTNMCVNTGGTGTIVSATLVDYAKVTGAVDCYLFSAASSPAADNAANSWADANMLTCVGILNFGTPITSALNSTAVLNNVGLGYTCAATSLFANFVTRTGHTFFGAATDLKLTVVTQLD